MKTVVKAEDMLRYLQSMLDDVKTLESMYDPHDRILNAKIDAMIACKEMVEALIQEPVNLQLDGKVTTGF